MVGSLVAAPATMGENVPPATVGSGVGIFVGANVGTVTAVRVAPEMVTAETVVVSTVVVDMSSKE